MNKMFWRIGLYIICFLLHIQLAQAYEFQRVNRLFTTIHHDYISAFNAKDVFLRSCDLIHQFDNSLKIYHSSSKAFLYRNDKLVQSFDLPQNDNSASWQNFITNVLSTCVVHSGKILSSADTLEDAVLKDTLQQLDGYSRLDSAKYLSSGIDYRIHNDVLYIRCDNFHVGISHILRKIIAQHPTMKGLVLDLRHNLGGDFNEAIKTADLFLDNVLIAYSSEKNAPNRFYNASAGDILNNKPIAILTGASTASAAEIVAAALSEQGRATLIGTKTYGKGSIQQVRRFDNQNLYLTNGYFFSPSGAAINQVGITPHICTGIHGSCDEKSSQNDLETAYEFIESRSI